MRLLPIGIKQDTQVEQNHQTVSELFAGYMAGPDALNGTDAKGLESLIQKFPYCQLLHSFYSKALFVKNDEKFEVSLAKSALYSPDRKVLYAIIHKPEMLRSFSKSASPASVASEDVIEEPAEEDLTFEEVSDFTVEQPFERREAIISIDEHSEIQEIAEAEGLILENFVSNDEIIFEDGLAVLETDVVNQGTPESNEDKTPNAKILEIDEAEKLILSNISSADYFAFEEKLDAHTQGTLSVQQPTDVTITDQTAVEEDHQTILIEAGIDDQVSKYDDDQMPYTFLWWLNRTRKEHAGTYQPYGSFKLDTTQNIKESSGDELNHQIIENIFHLQSPIKEVETKLLATTVQFEVKRKEGEIIEKFIKEEPQIKPPKPENLNMENKARKSAEDPNDLVSETLALIYTDQMLFHKAIDTYQKLSLKFPEKSTYFADQIRELEKKIN